MDHLINPIWFEHMGWPLLLIVGAVATFVLIKGADWLVEGASGVAYRIGMSEVIVGATIVSLGTTSPEAAVSVLAAFEGNSGLALGNAVGSIVADTGLIFGIGCLMTMLPADKFVLTRQGWVQFLSATLLAVLCFHAFFTHEPVMLADGTESVPEIARWVGFMLLGLLVVYMWLSVRWSKAHAAGEPFQIPDDVAQTSGPMRIAPPTVEKQERRTMRIMLGMVFIGLLLVVLSSHVMVECAGNLATRLGLPDVVIAATLVALGTSTPELVVGITSIRRGHPELLVGNVIGADILNVLFVIGASASAKSLPLVEPESSFPEIFMWVHLPAMILILVLFRIFITKAKKTGHFSRWMGIPMVGIWITHVILQTVLST